MLVLVSDVLFSSERLEEKQPVTLRETNASTVGRRSQLKVSETAC
jgi:hypothetical protein